MQIHYFKTNYGREPAKEYIDGLQMADKANIAFDLELIAKYGPQYDQVITRHLVGKLWEIKSGLKHQQRIFYCLVTNSGILLLHACKKQKTGSQPKDIEIALKRMKEALQ
jgi:phage-related protein